MRTGRWGIRSLMSPDLGRANGIPFLGIARPNCSIWKQYGLRISAIPICSMARARQIVLDGGWSRGLTVFFRRIVETQRPHFRSEVHRSPAMSTISSGEAYPRMTDMDLIACLYLLVADDDAKEEIMKCNNSRYIP